VDMDIATGADVFFNSMNHASMPPTECTVTIVSVGTNQEEDLKGAEAAIANGEVYFRDGKYWTLNGADINDALE